MDTSVSIIALRPHGNSTSVLVKKEEELRKNNSSGLRMYPFYPVFFPISILPSLPSSKKEALSVLSPVKDQLVNSKNRPVLEKLVYKDFWLYAELHHPALNSSCNVFQIAQFPPFVSGQGIPLSFSKYPLMEKTIEDLQGKIPLRVFTVSILTFSWNEKSALYFSWGETGALWVKFESV